ncbi:MAG: nuclear transport factor 2 family protein [Thermomicrobiales bacterium]
MTTTATDMTEQATQLADAYLAIWNEHDGAARQALIAETWATDGLYLDPLLHGEGHDGIDAAIGGVQPQFAGLAFRRTSDVDVHHDRLRFTWELGPEGAPPVIAGVDIGQIVDDRLGSIIGFFDVWPGSA